MSGVSSAVASEAAAETISPNASFNARDFSVEKTGAAVPSGGEIEVGFVIGGLPLFVCDITSGNTGCTGRQGPPLGPLAVPAGSSLSFSLVTRSGSVDGIDSYDLLFGWRATS